MATLQKFKRLATQCGSVSTQSPSRCSRTSPRVQHRRRKTTLRMLLNRSTTGRRSPRRRDPPHQLRHLMRSPEEMEEKGKGLNLTQKQSLKELFVSSPPKEEKWKEIPIRESDPLWNAALGGSGYMRNGSGSPKPAFRGFRLRSLLSKTWRPALDSIPE